MRVLVESKIQFASQSDCWFLRFLGDVRVTSSVAFDELVEKICADSGSNAVLVDMSEAVQLDSTTLGLLAKMALRLEKEQGKKPGLWGASNALNGLLDSMGMIELFTPMQHCLVPNCEDLSASDCSDQEACQTVIEAHRTLMQLSENNAAAFKDLVMAVENEALASTDYSSQDLPH